MVTVRLRRLCDFIVVSFLCESSGLTTLSSRTPLTRVSFVVGDYGVNSDTTGCGGPERASSHFGGKVSRSSTNRGKVKLRL